MDDGRARRPRQPRLSNRRPASEGERVIKSLAYGRPLVYGACQEVGINLQGSMAEGRWPNVETDVMNSLLKLLTYNMHKGVTPIQAQPFLSRMKQALTKVDCDLVLLQEICGEHMHDDTPQFEYLADKLWPWHSYGKNAVRQRGHHGNAILSKYSISSWENIKVTRLKRASRSFLHAVIDLPAASPPLHVICLHLGLFERERRKQVELLNHHCLQKIPLDEPLLVAGDFNDWTGNMEKYLEKTLGLQEVFKFLHGHHALSFPAKLPLLPLDRVYFRGLKVEYAMCLQRRPWISLSDHLPLYVEFSLP